MTGYEQKLSVAPFCENAALPSRTGLFSRPQPFKRPGVPGAPRPDPAPSYVTRDYLFCLPGKVA